MNKNILIKLAQLADELDNNNLVKEADIVTDVMNRVAQANPGQAINVQSLQNANRYYQGATPRPRDMSAPFATDKTTALPGLYQELITDYKSWADANAAKPKANIEFYEYLATTPKAKQKYDALNDQQKGAIFNQAGAILLQKKNMANYMDTGMGNPNQQNQFLSSILSKYGLDKKSTLNPSQRQENLNKAVFDITNQVNTNKTMFGNVQNKPEFIKNLIQQLQAYSRINQ